MIFTKENTPPGFYVYAYLRKTNLTPFYIGKGSGRRAWDKHPLKVPNNSRIIIVEANLTNVGALALERRLIKWYGRKDLDTGILRNLSDGGDGNPGVKWTASQRKKLIGRPAWNKGLTKETSPSIASRALAAKGRASPLKGSKLSNDRVAAMKGRQSWNKGICRNEETKKKISNSILQNLACLSIDEKKKKYGRNKENNAFYGKTHTKETIKHLQRVQKLIRQEQKLVCLHCQKCLDKPNYVRYHGDKCKFK